MFFIIPTANHPTPQQARRVERELRREVDASIAVHVGAIGSNQPKCWAEIPAHLLASGTTSNMRIHEIVRSIELW